MEKALLQGVISREGTQFVFFWSDGKIRTLPEHYRYERRAPGICAGKSQGFFCGIAPGDKFYKIFRSKRDKTRRV